jgi:3-oxoacyl-(acyl-carrier-protein) synthase
VSDAIVVTGIGCWTCFGRGGGALTDALRDGRSGLAPVEDLPFADDPWLLTNRGMPIPAEHSIASRLDGRAREVGRGDWPRALAVETALDAWAEARPDAAVARRRVAVAAGSSQGSSHDAQRCLLRDEAPHAVDAAEVESAAWVAREIARRIDARGPCLTLNTSCSSGMNAIGQMARLLEAGRVDCALAGGHDVLSFLGFAGFGNLRLLDKRGARPLDRAAQGMSLGSAAAFCVLEREREARRRGARVLATIAGYASGGEVYRPAAPDLDGGAAFEVMRSALGAAARPRELAWVLANAAGVPTADAAELAALGRLARHLDARRPILVSSFKGQSGHTLGASGALQVVAAAACMQLGLVPGTAGLTDPLPHPPSLSLPRAPLHAKPDLILCNSFGFGGSLSCIALRAP